MKINGDIGHCMHAPGQSAVAVYTPGIMVIAASHWNFWSILEIEDDNDDVKILCNTFSRAGTIKVECDM